MKHEAAPEKRDRESDKNLKLWFKFEPSRVLNWIKFWKRWMLKVDAGIPGERVTFKLSILSS